MTPIAPTWALSANIQVARMLGADHIWFPDHTRHFLPSSLWDPKTVPLAKLFPSIDAWFDPTVMIARYARRFALPMGTLVTDPIRRSAADLARAFLSLHHVTRGNVILGIGSGEAANVKPYGQSMEKSVSRLEDTLGALRAAWEADGASVRHRGAYHDWEGATFLPGWRGTTPPIWVGAQGPRGCRLAGRWGDGWISIFEELPTYRAALARVAEAAESAHRNPNGLERAVVLYGAVVSKPSLLEKALKSPLLRLLALVKNGQAWSAVGAAHPFGADFSGPHDLRPEMLVGETFDRALEMATPDVFRRLLPCGTASEVADQIADYVDAGTTHVAYTNLTGVAGMDVAIDSLREERRLYAILKRMRVKSI